MAFGEGVIEVNRKRTHHVLLLCSSSSVMLSDSHLSLAQTSVEFPTPTHGSLVTAEQVRRMPVFIITPVERTLIGQVLMLCFF